MPIAAGSRWWIATLVIVGILLGISALALDRPNVVWDHGEPRCPACRHVVEFYSSRCPHCTTDFDWTVSPQLQSRVSHASLSLLEGEWVKARVEALGLEEAARRVAEATGLTPLAALEYLGSVSRGDCGYCGGTRKDLDSPDLANAATCPLCFGTGTCIECGGDRYVSLGDWSAERAEQVYQAELRDLLRTELPARTLKAEARRLAERFLERHAGTVQAGRIYFWQRIEPARQRPRTKPDEEDLASRVSRARLDLVLRALREAE